MKAPCSGLSEQQVIAQRQAGLVNTPVEAPSKSVWEIVRSNVFTYFNFVFLLLAALLVLVGSIRDLTFLPLIVANSLIGIFQELRAKQVLDKLTMLNSPKARVVRDGEVKVIATDQLVLKDVVQFKAGDQIPADARVILGEVAVNESLLTGEADEINKKKDADLLSGSFVVSGECYAELTKVGEKSYINQLTLKAKKIRSGEQSEIIRSLNNLVRIIGIAIIPIAILMFAQQYILKDMPAKMSVQTMVAAIIGMIPEGLFLLASITLALSAMRLAKNQVLVHDMKCIETLARVDVLCVDKTGTITTTDMKVVKVEWLQGDETEAAAAVVAQLDQDNATMAALKKYFRYKEHGKSPRELVQKVGFSSKYKYSGVEFREEAFVFGAPQFIYRENYKEIKARVEEYAKKGYRVLLFAKYQGRLEQNKPLSQKVEPLGLVVLANQIRETAPATFKYFEEQGVAVKVISGDDAATVSEVARQAGIAGAENYIDASTLTKKKDLEAAILKYTVFGRVTPEQKLLFVKALQKNKHIVAMTGDGVNDVLALKDADCSVAMASGAEAAVQASQLVLLESDFAKMPEVVREGRQVVNNLERSGSLFLVKNIFSLSLAVLTICFAITYPMIPTQVSMVTLFTIGVPSFLLAQIPNEKLIEGQFIQNVMYRATPAALTNIVLIGICIIAGRLLGLSFSILSTCCVMIWAVVGLIYLFHICRPFDIYKKAIFGICVAGMLFCMIFLRGLFGLEYDGNWQTWVMIAAIALLVVPVMKLMRKIVDRVVRFYQESMPKIMEKFPLFRKRKVRREK